MDNIDFILPASGKVTDLDIGLFIIGESPPRMSLPELLPPAVEQQTPCIPTSLAPTYPTTLLNTSNNIPDLFSSSLNLSESHITISVIPANSAENALMDVRRKAALSLPHRRARRPAIENQIAPSEYRPLVPADRRLLLWTTPHSLVAQQQLDDKISRRLQTLIYEKTLSSTVLGTRESYGAGLLRFNQFCNREGITESRRMPASAVLLGAFIADVSGKHTGACIRGWMSGLQLWHTYNYAEWHGKEWLVPNLKKTAEKEGVIFKRPLRGPITKDHLRALHSRLNLCIPMHAAIWSVALVAFWACRRLGELLVQSRKTFNILLHVTRSARILRLFVSGRAVHSIHLPWTKTTGTAGGECLITATDDEFCPVVAFDHHLTLNHTPSSDTPLFAYRECDTWVFLTKGVFLNFSSAIYKEMNLENVFGHSYRIGGSLILLMAGVEPEFVMKIGGWTSLCFLLYWRRLEQVLPAAIVRAWDAQIKGFATRHGIVENPAISFESA